MLHDLSVSVEALVSLLETNGGAAKVLHRFQAEAKEKLSAPYALALKLIDETEAKLKESK